MQLSFQCILTAPNMNFGVPMECAFVRAGTATVMMIAGTTVTKIVVRGADILLSICLAFLALISLTFVFKL